MLRERNSSNSYSVFRDLSFRELNRCRVRTRPWLPGVVVENDVIALEHDGDEAIPFALSFCEINGYHHLLAASDEEGYLSLFDTRKVSPSFTSLNRTASRACEWVAHKNAIFDVCWLKGFMCVLTASGDQTIKAWNTETKKCVGTMKGHSGSVKSVSSHPSNPDCFASGSRDGSFALWDLREESSSSVTDRETSISPLAQVKNAHSASKMKRKRGKVASTSITSVLYLKDGVSIASGGAGDSVVKLWDTRNLKSPLTQGCPAPDRSDTKVRTLHGISCLSQDLSGTLLAASCMDDSIYLYDVLNLEKGPRGICSSCDFKIDSFFIKSRISPDAAHILSGSSDGNVYMWQTQSSESAPLKFSGHASEVNAVDWCPSGFGKFATSSDDGTVRVWELREGSSRQRPSPAAASRKRVTAFPFSESSNILGNHTTSDSTPANQRSPTVFSTPPASSSKKRRPDSSPSSVLNPPSSKRTIRDYFLAAHTKA
ncbi:transducin/WD40 repeat-like superfamily protein [Wolffia australiana]